MEVSAKGFVFAGTLDELKDKGRLLVRGHQRPILLLYDQDRVFALDNRCPHMGFPLQEGSVDGGILTCHWHHARFDLASGCTFDLWADDVPTCPVEVRDGEIWVKPDFKQVDPLAHWRRRLDDGMAHNLGLVSAKSIYGLRAAGAAPAEIVRQAALFGARNRDGWNTGLTILTALGNLLPLLPEEETYLALFHGTRRVAADCAGEPPRRERAPLASAPELATLTGWLQRWTAVRHREAAERTLLTAIAAGASPAELADMVFTAETDRTFADGGHSLDFVNKAFECLDLIGWEYSALVLPTVVSQMVTARGCEESTAWRQPIDLVVLHDEVFAELPGLFAAGRDKRPYGKHATLAPALLADDPVAVVETLKGAIAAGAAPVDLGRALAYAAALRLAHFGTANEHSDWETAHHAFTYCNALHRALQRIRPDDQDEKGFIEAVRGIFHGAIAIYLARYLNVPPAPLPGEDGGRLDELPSDSEKICVELLDAFDRQRQVDTAARLVARYLLLGHHPEALLVTLAHALLREDAGFHAYQMLEAGVRQFHEWGNTDEGRHILIGMTRYLAAHSPTERAAYQTAEIARRLMRGGQLHEEVDAET